MTALRRSSRLAATNTGNTNPKINLKPIQKKINNNLKMLKVIRGVKIKQEKNTQEHQTIKKIDISKNRDVFGIENSKNRDVNGIENSKNRDVNGIENSKNRDVFGIENSKNRDVNGIENSKNRDVNGIENSKNRDEFEQALKHLSKTDSTLEKIISKNPLIPDAIYGNRTSKTAFESLIRAIIGQQISTKAASSIFSKFLNSFGKVIQQKIHKPISGCSELSTEKVNELTPDNFIFPDPKDLLVVEIETLKQCGVSQKKAEYIKGLALYFAESGLDDTALDRLSDSEMGETLIEIKGIGQWSIDMLLMFHFKRMDVFPALDLKIKKSMCIHFNLPFTKKSPKNPELINLAKVWEPYRSVASFYLWRYDSFAL
ncbi:hypothetical protein BB561_002344 [Smittium simulii]|uniref:HhH-GPD domain-containing protein n=1 Tax=Smittium simulii TaxID=133385 RepID=A0A2T9YQT0_9FUNG|nr:hypothetical protein BB561_002344 [Smittium simulii]